MLSCVTMFATISGKLPMKSSILFFLVEFSVSFHLFVKVLKLVEINHFIGCLSRDKSEQVHVFFSLLTNFNLNVLSHSCSVSDCSGVCLFALTFVFKIHQCCYQLILFMLYPHCTNLM